MTQHIKRALAYRLVCSLRRRWILLTIFIAIPVLLSGLFVQIKSSGVFHSGGGVPEPPTYGVNFTKHILLTSCHVLSPIAVSPNNDLTQKIIAAVKSTFQAESIDFGRDGELRFFDDAGNAAAWMANITKNNFYGTCGFGIEFSDISNSSFNYTLRSIVADGWFTTTAYPGSDQMVPGPMENFNQYFHKGFVALQIAINEAYSRLNLGLPMPNWQLRGFPYPSYEKQNEYSILYMVMGYMNSYGLTFLLSRFAVMMIQEKTSGIKELLKINGVRTWMIYASWFIMFGLITSLIALIVTTMWKWPLKNGATLTFTNPFVLFIILVNFYWCALASVGFLSSFITEPRYGMLFVVFYWIGSNIFVSEMIMRFRNVPMLVFLGLLPNGGIYGILEAIAQFEAGGTGATFGNLFKSPPVPTLIFPIGLNMALMLLGAVIYLLLMAYVDAVKPGPYGRAKPWHFIFPKFSKVQAESAALLSEHRQSSALMEAVDKDTPVGLKAASLSKVFGSLVAVDHLTLTFYKNQITALLGHNGAGKSTLFSMISGMYSPTSGTVYTGDMDIFRGDNITLFRQQLGLCPQHDLLIDELTVEQHLIFFGMLKGLTKREAKAQSDHWTEKFQLQVGRHKMVSELSGGMKRKLCLSIALVGNPQFLLLDEPTSGLDPESRRDIWDVLLTVRGNRTIIISTHFMEEADVLGDRIAIVAHGRLKCFGTGMFLKKHFSSGYQLNITMKNKVDGLKKEILNRIEQSQVVNETDTMLSISLPSSQVRKFPDLFQVIEKKYSNDIVSSLSCTTMDDVFLKVQESEGVQMTIDETDMPTMLKETQDIRSMQSAMARIVQQMMGFLIKRFKWALYNWPSFLFFMVICPMLGMYLNIAGCNHAQEQSSIEKLQLNLDVFKDSLVYIAKQNGPDRLSDILEADVTLAGSSYMEVKSTETLETALLDAATADLLKYRSQMAVAFDTRGQPVGFFATLPYHSLPISYGMLSNALIKANNRSATITTYNYPYEFNEGDCSSVSVASIQFIILWTIYGALMGMVTSYFVMFPHTERITFMKHLQIMTGARPLVYWLSTFIADFTMFILPVLLSLLVLILMDTYNVFYYCIILSVFVLVSILYGIGAIFFAYFCSYFLKTYTSAMELNLFLCWIVAVVSVVGSAFESTQWFPYLFNLLPWVPYTVCLKKIVSWALQARMCTLCAVGPAADMCKHLYDDATIKSFDMKVELIYLAVDPFVFLLLILLIDHGLFRMAQTHIHAFLYGSIDGQIDATDVDVTTEKETVDAARSNASENTAPIFICDDLGKKFSRSFTAVYDVTFAVQKGECFGLLGVNGAGKSTTFGMLTGTIAPTRGDARLLQYGISSNRHSYLQRLGYCPQLDGLLPEMSARTHLSLFGRLRGIPASELDHITQRWIDALDMTDICDRPCKEYSGGNKRKLSTAMALIGDPPVVLLDEPTTGVDPVVRRKIWSILKFCRRVNHQTIIITSHSMDECEAVCGRLTIMVKGLMKCIGTIPRLKKVYGKGYVLLVKLQFKASEEEAQVVKSEVMKRFDPHITLQDEQFGLYNFHINTEHVKVDKMFEIMNHLKNEYPIIEDFSLSDISLEQVFLSLAKGGSVS